MKQQFSKYRILCNESKWSPEKENKQVYPSLLHSESLQAMAQRWGEGIQEIPNSLPELSK